MQDSQLARSEFYQPLIAKYQASSYAISLAWLMAKGTHIVPIPGMDNKHHVVNNFQSISLKLRDEDIQSPDVFPDLYSPKHVEQQ
jgi:diketogulonate reductase-like aldo/keto reductase